MSHWQELVCYGWLCESASRGLEGDFGCTYICVRWWHCMAYVYWVDMYRPKRNYGRLVHTNSKLNVNRASSLRPAAATHWVERNLSDRNFLGGVHWGATKRYGLLWVGDGRALHHRAVSHGRMELSLWMYSDNWYCDCLRPDGIVTALEPFNWLF